MDSGQALTHLCEVNGSIPISHTCFPNSSCFTETLQPGIPDSGGAAFNPFLIKKQKQNTTRQLSLYAKKKKKKKKKKKNLSVASSGFSRFLRWAIRPLRVDLICSFCLCAPHVFQSESCSLECARLFLFWKLHPSFPCPLATAGEYKLKAEFPYLGINVPKTSSYPFLHSLFQSWGWENGVID